MFELSRYRLLSQNRLDPNSKPHNGGKRTSEYKNAFLSDLERIHFSSSFRRLQDKAQVYPLEPNDYARTRLTHSLEVAAIASSLGNIIIKNLKRKYDSLSSSHKKFKAYIIKETDINYWKTENNRINKEVHKFKSLSQDVSLTLQCSGLLHDIGNPPFGHFGEDVIKEFFKKIFYVKDNMKRFYSSSLSIEERKIYDKIKNKQMINDLIHFDGNAQTIRIVTFLQVFNSKNYGLGLTQAVVGSLFKYPYSSIDASFSHEKFGYFFTENQLIKELESMNTGEDWLIFHLNKRNPLSLIMEAADDISCIVSDFDDAVQKGNIKYEDIVFIEQNITEFVDKNISVKSLSICNKFINNVITNFKNNQKNKITEPLRGTICRMLADERELFKKECANTFISNYHDIMTGSFGDTLIIKSDYNEFYNFLFKIKKYFVFPQKEIVSAELQGKNIIKYLLKEFTEAILSEEFDKFISNPKEAKGEKHKVLQFISKNYVDAYKKSILNVNDTEIVMYYKLRLAIDHISGMTDTYAKDTFLLFKGVK